MSCQAFPATTLREDTDSVGQSVRAKQPVDAWETAGFRRNHRHAARSGRSASAAVRSPTGLPAAEIHSIRSGHEEGS